MNKSKKELRADMIQRLSAQPQADRSRKSIALKAKLMQLPEFQRAQTILFYVSLIDEVDTHRMIDEALAMGKRVAVPRCVVESKALLLYEITDRSELVRGVFGLDEPDPAIATPVAPGEVDLAIVPGVVFDRQANRIGHGVGYYDRFLRLLKPQTPKVGLAFEFQLVSRVPVEPHDIRLDKIITEEG